MIKRSCNLFIMTIISVIPLFGQNDTISKEHLKEKSLKDSFALFGSNDLLEITLRFDITRFLKKNQNGLSLDADMSIHINKTDSLNLSIKIKNRGHYRYENCDFPPMELAFKNSLQAYPDSGKIKKLKLVTHCKVGSIHEEYVLREFMVYKLFNIISDTSYRVRLLKVTYIDTHKDRKPIIQYGFFIEPLNVLAERLNSVPIKTTTLTQKHIVPEVMDRITIFNYMVANWDWTVPLQHNITVLKSLHFTGSGLGFAIPYDFDLTGIVNVDYAVTPPEYPLTSIRDRIFLGICRDRTVFERELKYFLGKKAELYSEIDSFPYLKARAKKDITSFLDQFYDKLENKKSFDSLVDYFLSTCKKL